MINAPTLPASLGMSDVPEPMRALTHVVISPQNIALEARLTRARPMGKMKIWRLKLEARSLQRQIHQANPEQVAAQLHEAQSRFQQLLIQRLELGRQLQAAPDDTDLKERWDELQETLTSVGSKGKKLQSRLNEIRGLIRTRKSILQRIEDNPEVIIRARQEEETHRIQTEEARSYEQLIIDRFTQLGYCYRWTDNHGRKRVDEVRFSECHVTMDAVYFKIAASHRLAFGAWRTRIPPGVHIADLVKEETLIELSLACQRQISSRINVITGAWVIVHRLDTSDGLLNEVGYPDIMKTYPRKYHSRFPLCAGVAQHKQVQWLNLVDYPNMLVAGFAGSGKSNFVNSLICTLITQHSPEEVRLVLVDLKDGLEFSLYEHIPHLHGEVIDRIPTLADRLTELEAVMQMRYQEMKGKAKSLLEYQTKFPAAKMPRIICIIDEVASIMGHGDSTKRINASLRQLAAKGRAAGIHIILSTQRPSVDAIEGGIKINLHARIVGRMPSHTDSITVIGTGDAKDLAAIAGRMILQISSVPIPIQTAFMEEHDVIESLKIAMTYAAPGELPIPEGYTVVDEWTPEKVVELSLKYLNGNISHKPIWEEIKDDARMSRRQVRELVETIWKMDCIPFENKQYRVQRGAHGTRKLIEIEQVAKSPASE